MFKISLPFILWFTFALTAFGNDYSHLDPDRIIPSYLLTTATSYYEQHLNIITNKRFMGIIDFRQHNSRERFFIVDMESGRVEKYLVAHGKKSDPNFEGRASKFSNLIDSNMSSLGFYLTAETYSGAHGYSLRLDGLSPTNSNARERDIVIHSADYVYPGDKIGRSLGCPVIEPRFHQQIIDELKNGSLIYAAF